LALHLVRRAGDDVAVGNQLQRRAARHQVLVEIHFLLRQRESQPFRKNLVMTVAESAVGYFGSHHLA
jgi:hypothetical protein